MPDDCVLAFDSDDPEFIRGFEAGALWARLEDQPVEFEQIVHGTNAEMMLRLAEATGRTVTSEDSSEDWMTVWFSPQSLV